MRMTIPSYCSQMLRIDVRGYGKESYVVQLVAEYMNPLTVVVEDMKAVFYRQ